MPGTGPALSELVSGGGSSLRRMVGPGERVAGRGGGGGVEWGGVIIFLRALGIGSQDSGLRRRSWEGGEMAGGGSRKNRILKNSS